MAQATAPVLDSTGEGAQAAGDGGYGWARPDFGCAACQHPGPGWRTSNLAPVAAVLPVHLESLRRHGLCRGWASDGHLDLHRDRQEAAQSSWVCRAPSQMGSGEVLRLDQPEPAALERPGGHAHVRPSVPLRRIPDAPHPPVGPGLMSFGTDSYTTSG